ncbi:MULTISPECIES: phage tail tape measure protein [unclassified Oceanobacillus]|uniref:phage tail tape measure protein n=1 Tax=unclassified Oceanobacillus TaxID=2630292 RepID=UPI001BEC7E88|nr:MULTISPECIES: phage tail tape measure protein [unclassified Oceanobacillus]MBT2600941.1 phage tail tape measure protein [Oceanobacillus sp. ISL-74]MBT2653608.1 phage tail tape measure protein [Oceanobacillus sp. ISL-73]
MATRDIGALRTRLSFEDEGANNSLNGFKRDLRGLRSEMKLAQSGGSDYTNSLKGMREQSDILTRRFKTQEAQVKELRKRYNESKEVKGEDAVQTKNLASEYNKAAAEMNRTEEQLKNLNEEIRRQESPWTKMGTDLTNAGEKMQNVGRQMSDFGKNYTMRVTTPIVAGGVAVFKAASDYESAFAGVRKTVDATEEEYAKLSRGIRDMAKEIPAAATEIASVAEAAGQLGIQNENIEEFTRTMIDLGEATNMTSEQAATEFARFANIVGMSQGDFDKLGSTLVDLGNNLATTESEISSMALRLAGAGAQIGLTEAEILAFSASLSSVGIEAEAGGSAFSKVMVNMQLAAERGGDDLKAFADVAGMSASDFKTAFEEDAAAALISFIEGLSKVAEDGDTAIGVLDEMGITEVRMRDALLRAAGASDVFTDAINMGSNAWEENTALTKEAEQRYATTESQLKILWNRIKDMAITLGDALIPAVMDAVDAAEPLIQKIEDGAQAFADMSEEEQQTILKTIALVAAIGPASIALGGMTTAIGGVLKVGGSVASMIGKAGGVGLAGRIGLLGMGGPVGLAIGGVAALGAVFLATRDDGEKLHDINLDVAQSLADQHTELSEAAESYKNLRNQANLTSDEFGEMLDIRQQLADNPEASSIAELEERYEELRKKSGLTNEQLEALIEHNQTIVDNAPHTAEAHTNQGNAIAGVNDELETYLNTLRETSLQNIELEKMKWAENETIHQKNLNEAKQEQQKIDEQIQMLGDLQSLSALELEDRYWKVVDAQSNYQTSQEDLVELAKEEELLKMMLEEDIGTVITKLQEQRETQQGIIDDTEIELEKGKELDGLHAEILLKKVGINEKGEEGIKIAEKRLEELREEHEELQKRMNTEGDVTGELGQQLSIKGQQIGELENILALVNDESGVASELIDKERKRKAQIDHVNDVLSSQERQLRNNNSRIDDGTGKARDLTNELKKDVKKGVSISATPALSAFNRDWSKPISKTVNLTAQVATTGGLTGAALRGMRGYAKGTKSHPGGAFIAGEEGWELGRMGNRWDLLNFGLYDRPQGYQVFPHDESKKILNALNNTQVPGYATGARPSGEANRIIDEVNRRPSGPITQNINIYSPEPTSPAENARRMKQASRQLAMEGRW